MIQREMKELASQGQEEPGKEEQDIFSFAKFPRLAWTEKQCDEWLETCSTPRFASFVHVSVYFTFLTLDLLFSPLMYVKRIRLCMLRKKEVYRTVNTGLINGWGTKKDTWHASC